MRSKGNSTGGMIFDILNHFMLLIFLIITIYPFYYIFIYSISDPALAQKGIGLFPAGFTLDSYISVLRLRGMLDSSITSLFRTVIGTALTVICSSFFAFILTKKRLVFRKAIYRFVVISIYLNAGFIPWYITMKALGLRNNFLLYVLPSAVTAFYIILIKTYIEQLPAALEESAKIDGAGYITVFVRIIFPVSMPIVATISVFAAVYQWNTWIDNFFLVENPRLMTLQLTLYNYLNQANAISIKSISELSMGNYVKQMTPMSIKMTMTMVVTLPILLIYPSMQRYFVKGIMIGAIKG